ncbi:MAG: sulfatase-like hydrolase/transferase [Tenuifilaceae bacterium]
MKPPYTTVLRSGSGLLLSLFFSLNANAQKKPNLLFIMTDQQRYDALSIAGNTVLKTPNLDRLAKQGVYFKNAYTPCAVSGPARSCILTGTTVENNGVKTNGHTYDFVQEGLMTMPTFDEILSSKGYRCEYYGKWHVLSSHAEIYKNPTKTAKNGKSVFGNQGQALIYYDYIDEKSPKRNVEAGELFDPTTNRPYIPDPLDKYYGKTYDEVVKQKLKAIQPDLHGKLMIDKEHSLTAFQAKQTIEAIERLKDSTFSITCSFHFPHSPILPTEPYHGMYPVKDMMPPFSISDDMENSPYKKANGRLGLPEYADSAKIKYMISNYYGLVTEIDDWVGKILAKLDELGLAENTIVVFTSDHGEMLGAHGLREKNIFLEESAHIPLFIRFPEKIKENTVVNGYVSLIDLFATILDYTKVGKHKSDGKSLRGLIEGKDKKHGEYVVTEWDYRGDTESNYMVLKDGWKLIIPYSETSKVINAMYNLNNDPHEMNNLIGSNPDRHKNVAKTEELRKCLLEWLKKNKSKHFDGVKKRQLI